MQALPPVTIFKPVHGMEERLQQNLASFFEQDYPDYEIIIGARSADDPAIVLAGELQRRYPNVKSRIVTSGPPEWPHPYQDGRQAWSPPVLEWRV